MQRAGRAWAHARTAAAAVLGEDAVGEVDTQMTGEDFAFLTEALPAAYTLLGAYNVSAGATHALHSPSFVLDEAVLMRGVALHVETALSYLAAPFAAGDGGPDRSGPRGPSGLVLPPLLPLLCCR